jgi:hypothetical protein
MEIIEVMEGKRPATYLGDAVYAIFDGCSIWLRLDDHRNENGQICLDPKVFKALVNFEKESKTEEVIKLCQQ